MKQILVLFLVIVTTLQTSAQVVGTPYGITREQTNTTLLLDLFPSYTPSFAFSTRKLRVAYSGPALRLYRDTDQSEVDVAFDLNGVVSDNSVVTFKVVGTSGAALESTTTLATYKGSLVLYVSIWYDQGANANHAVQADQSFRPVFELNAAGNLNQYSALHFTGSAKQHLEVNQPIENLLGNVPSTTNGLYGSIGLIAKPTVAATGAGNNSFGFLNSTDSSKRWLVHLNWPDGGLYSDFGFGNDWYRSFLNTSNQNIYKQYTFVRGTSHKLVRFSSRDAFGFTLIPLNYNDGAGVTGGSFGIGIAKGDPITNGFWGFYSEFVLFKESFTMGEIVKMEINQLNFWRCTN